MKEMTVEEIGKALDAEVFGDKSVKVNYVSIDSRKIEKGTLFVALRGERFDGHDFADAAAQRASALMVSRRLLNIAIPQIVVPDTELALGALGAYVKAESNVKTTVAVTGSVGKTTTKELIACVLLSSFSVHKTIGNFNNNIGLPLTLESIKDEETLVLEMGMDKFGEIEYLSKLARPDIGVITNIGISHIEHLKTREGICRAKLEIVAGMKVGGTLIVNGDEPLLRKALTGEEYTGYNKVYVGKDEHSDIYYSDVVSCGGNSRFTIHFPGGSAEAVLPLAGEHNILNATFAFAVGHTMGISPEKIVEGFGRYEVVGYRQHIYEANGINVIADCYNASPDSMKAALKVLMLPEFSLGKRIAVLGNMLELGDNSEIYHRQIGSFAAALKPEYIFTCGDMAKMIVAEALEAGFTAKRICAFNDKNTLCTALSCVLKPGDTLLLKASRAEKFEEILSLLGLESK